MTSTSTAPTPEPRNRRAVLGILLVIVTSVLFVTMPRLLYSGDPIAIRLTTVNLINAGRIDVAPSLAQQFGERGQYFFENTDRGRWYSKYGLLNTYFYAPPLLAERLIAGELRQITELDDAGRQWRCLLLNLWNIVTALVLAIYLFQAATQLGARPWPAALFVLLTIFGTFLWYYLRAQTVEILQVTLFTAAAYHLWRFSVLPTAARTGRTGAVQATLAIGLLGLLSLAKLIYVVLLPMALLAILVLATQPENARSPWPDLRKLVRPPRISWPVLSAVTACAAICMASILISNWQRFGSPWSTGYTQFARESTLFRPGFEGVWGYVSDSQKSIFIYFPVMLLALIGMLRLPRGHRAAYGWIWAAFIVLYVVNASFVNWRGDWSYGPRYLLFALPMLSLPLVLLLAGNGLPRFGRALVAVGVLMLSLMSVNAMFSIHGVGWFAAFQAQQCFEDEEPRNEDLAKYFQQPHWRINSDLWEYRMGKSEFPPLRLVEDTLTSDQLEQRAQQLQQLPLQNYYWPGQLGPRVAHRDVR